MNPCSHCNGTGLVRSRADAVLGNALGKLPPYGREVELAAREGRLPVHGVSLLYKPCPANGHHGEIDAWKMATNPNLSPPHIAMVLPIGADIRSFRWPRVPPEACDPQIVFWAYDCSDAEQTTIAQALIDVGYEHVLVLGGPDCPITVKAKPSWAA